MNRRTWPILLCVLLLANFALAQPDSTHTGGLITAKLEAIFEAALVVVLMVIRGLSDPQWRTTFLNLTNAVGLVQAVNAVLILVRPGGGIGESLQMLLARGLAIAAMFLFSRKASGASRIMSAVGVLMGKPDSELPLPKLPETRP